jgi:hypothetical protein
MNKIVVAFKSEIIASLGNDTLSVGIYFKLNTENNLTSSRCETIANLGRPGEMIVHSGTYEECHKYCDAMVQASEAEQASMETSEHLEQS